MRLVFVPEAPAPDLPSAMKRRFRWAMLTLACCVLAGCRAQPPVTRDAAVGTYNHVSNDPAGNATDHNRHHLALRADGTYDLIERGKA